MALNDLDDQRHRHGRPAAPGHRAPAGAGGRGGRPAAVRSAGPNVMAGYLRAGGAGRVEPPDGRLVRHRRHRADRRRTAMSSIVGRAKRFAKVGGEMVSLAAVEALRRRVWPDAPRSRRSRSPTRARATGSSSPSATRTARLDASLAPLQAQARREGIAEIMLPARVIALPELPLLGSGKPDYPGLERLVLEKEGA